MAKSLASIHQVTDVGMITIRADLAALGQVISGACHLTIPAQTGCVDQDGRSLCWMSPDELLLILPKAEVAQALTALTEALSDHHALVVDMSDARVIYDVIGAHAGDVIAKLAPVDQNRLSQGQVRRTRLAQTAAALWRVTGGVRLIGFRSSADYLALILTNAALPGTELAPW